MSTTETNSSQLDREALLCVFGVKRLHLYTSYTLQVIPSRDNSITDVRGRLPIIDHFREIPVSPLACRSVRLWAARDTLPFQVKRA